MAYLLGIDIGTSATKALLLTPRGQVAASASESYPVSQPRPGWSEQSPALWWEATVHAVRRALAQATAAGDQVVGIGLAGQMHGSVFLDAADRVIRPCILWNDQRTAAECAEIETRVGRKRLLRLACNPALTGFTAPKVLWLRNHEPRRFDRLRRVLLPKDYVRLCLTGEHATEVSDASGTLFLDVPRRRWSKEVLAALDLDESLLPTCTESPEVSGRLTRRAAADLGLAEATPVVGGGGDNAAGAVGNGVVRPGVIFSSIGTSGVVFAHSDAVHTDPQGRAHTFCHAVPGAWHVMGVVLAAGGAFQWFRDALGQPEIAEAQRQGVDPYDLLTAAAESVPPGAEGLLFLPYLTGERTPHADPEARGAFIGLTARHTKAHLARAVIEGAAFALRDSYEIITGMGIPVRTVIATGGGARSALWRQIQADVYARAVATRSCTEGPALGAALLAGVGAGLWDSVPEACDATLRLATTTKPVARNVRLYQRYYDQYVRLYPALRESFHALGALAKA
jgi:xylulokinase